MFCVVFTQICNFEILHPCLRWKELHTANKNMFYLSKTRSTSMWAYLGSRTMIRLPLVPYTVTCMSPVKLDSHLNQRFCQLMNLLKKTGWTSDYCLYNRWFAWKSNCHISILICQSVKIIIICPICIVTKVFVDI